MKRLNPLLITIVGAIIIVALSVYLSIAVQAKPKLETTQATTGDISQGLKTTGSVVAAQDIALGFQGSGSISRINIASGDHVKAGQVLMALDNKGASASINSAQAAVEVANANYQKVLNGSTSEQINVAQTAYNNAKIGLATAQSQQQVLVSNALRTLLNSSVAAIPGGANSDSVTPIISGTYTGTTQGSYNISLYSTGSGLMFSATGPETSSGNVSTSPQLLGKNGLFIQFPTSSVASNDSWTINIPNTQGATYVSNYNAYQSALQTQASALQTAQAQVDSTQAALALAQTSARPEDVASAKAQVDAANAMLQSASNIYSNGLIVAPADGTITAVSAKVGEISVPGKTVVDMISDQTYQIQVYVSESELTRIKLGDQAQVTLDAYGSGTSFNASIIAIDPSATSDSGQLAYKVTLQFIQNDSRIKEGMGANVVVNDAQKSSVVQVPATDIFSDSGTQFVLKTENGKLVHQTVTTGLESADGMVEVTSGLSAGDQIVSLGK